MEKRYTCHILKIMIEFSLLQHLSCESGGTGRRTGFRFQRVNRAGSSPVSRTN